MEEGASSGKEREMNRAIDPGLYRYRYMKLCIDANGELNQTMQVKQRIKKRKREVRRRHPHRRTILNRYKFILTGEER